MLAKSSWSKEMYAMTKQIRETLLDEKRAKEEDRDIEKQRKSERSD